MSSSKRYLLPADTCYICDGSVPRELFDKPAEECVWVHANIIYIRCIQCQRFYHVHCMVLEEDWTFDFEQYFALINRLREVPWICYGCRGE